MCVFFFFVFSPNFTKTCLTRESMTEDIDTMDENEPDRKTLLKNDNIDCRYISI